MKKPAHLVKQLVALSIAASCGVLDPAASLLRFPSEWVESAIEEVDGSIPGEERKRLLELLAQDPRANVRARVAEVAVTWWPEPRLEAQEILRRLAVDEASEVRAAVGSGLRALFESVSPIARLELACRWATAPTAGERVAIALALRSKVAVFASDLVLEQLALDADAEVRRAAALAIERRFHENPEVYARIARELAADSDGSVRQAAASVLAEA